MLLIGRLDGECARFGKRTLVGCETIRSAEYPIQPMSHENPLLGGVPDRAGWVQPLAQSSKFRMFCRSTKHDRDVVGG
jgi:hypothetical protein